MLAVVLLVVSGFAAAGAVAARDAGILLAWVGNAFQAAYVTLTMLLVVLTYNLFAVASRVSDQNERIHRISQLPLVVADVKPLSFEPYPSYEIQIMNEGSGPALDIDVTLEYRLKDGPAAGKSSPLQAGAVSDARLRIGVMNKASHTGTLLIDARGIILTKPWKGIDLARTGAPSRSETAALLVPYDLVVTITYKDIYSQEGHTTYEAVHAAGDVGLELTELVAPSVKTGSDVKPIAFTRREPVRVPAGAVLAESER